jgi:PEP-CTERM motif
MSLTNIGSMLIASNSVFSKTGALFDTLLTSISVQVPEPGVTLLFGLGVAALGLRIGRKRR